MTRPSQERAERDVLDRLLSAESIVPEAFPVKCETPDFIAQIAGRAIGIEVTTYQSGRMVSVSGHGRLPLRRAEAEWDHLQCYSTHFRNEHPYLQKVGVIFWFWGIVPRKKYQEFLLEIQNFLSSRHNELAERFVVYSNYQFSSPLMVRYLTDIAANVHHNAEWDSNRASGGFSRPARRHCRTDSSRQNHR